MREGFILCLCYTKSMKEVLQSVLAVISTGLIYLLGGLDIGGMLGDLDIGGMLEGFDVDALLGGLTGGSTEETTEEVTEAE